MIEDVVGEVVEISRGYESLRILLDECRECSSMTLIKLGHDVIEQEDRFGSHDLVHELDGGELHHEHDGALLTLGGKESRVFPVDEKRHLVLMWSDERYSPT